MQNREMPLATLPNEPTASDANGTSRLPTHLNRLNGITIIAAFLPMIGAMRPAMAAAPFEALFRLSNLMLEQGGASPPLWREIGVAALSPSAGFNRLAFGKRRDASFPDLGTRTQSRGTISIFYTLLGPDGFGNVD